MRYPTNMCRTAIMLVAVLVLGLAVGCVTKRDIEEVKSQLSEMEAQNRHTQDLVAQMDSIITAGAAANDALRGELRYSVSEVSTQIDQLLEGYNELLNLLNELKSEKKVIVLPPKSSPGAQTDEPMTGQPSQPPVEPMRPAFDCDSAYDTSFLLVRQGEYQKAIDGFASFLDNCKEHENVENAHYWTGESYYALEKYAQAVEVLTRLLADFPGSLNTARALYKLGRSQQELGKTEEAKKIFKQLSEEYPNEMEGRQAKERLKDLEG